MAGLAWAMSTARVQAQSTVYFFFDLRLMNSSYTFQVNGENAFVLTGEACEGLYKGLYNMMARKVIFKHPDNYLISTDMPFRGMNYHADVHLNLEDGETYYVLCNGNFKRSFYMEEVSTKEGKKLLKKAQKKKKYTFNEDFIYDK